MTTDQRRAGDEARRSGVGVVGLGLMGTPMATNLLRGLRDGDGAGREVWAWARRPAAVDGLEAAGAHRATDCRSLAAACGVVVVVLPDLPQLEGLLGGEDGLLAGVEAPTLLVVCSTVSPTGVEELAARLEQETGGLVSVVDAPVSGGTEGAADATLSIMVGGSDEDVAVASPVLSTMGTPVHLGPLGSGQVAKACNQLIVAATISALSEAAVIAERSGLDLAALMGVLGSGYAGSRILASRGQRLVEHDHTVAGPARYMIKDLDAALAAAAATGTGTRVLPAVRRAYGELVDAGMGDLDMSVVQAWVETLEPPAPARGDGRPRQDQIAAELRADLTSEEKAWLGADLG